MDAMDKVGGFLPSENIRPSVFSRLSKANMDERLNIPAGLVSKLDFASVVGAPSPNVLQFYPLKDKVQSRVAIPVDLAKKAAIPFRSTLYGYFLGPSLPYLVISRYVKAAWGKFGFSDMMVNSNGIYFFKFNDVGGCDHVVESGPLMIRGVPLFVSKWEPTKGLSKPVHTSCPLWVKLHNIPLVAFNTEGISRIASALGVPMQMDACTASMCDKSWGRPGFAKVLIDVWAVGELKREIELAIPNLNGGYEVPVTIKVEYLWEPTQCSHCLVFGHTIKACASSQSNSQIKNPVQVANKTVDEDGFTPVARKEWRKKGASPGKTTGNGTSSNGAGENDSSVPQKCVTEEVSGNDFGSAHSSDSSVSGENITNDGVDNVNMATSNAQPETVLEASNVVEQTSKGTPTKSGKDRLPEKISEKVSVPPSIPPKPPRVPIRSILKNPNRSHPVREELMTADGRQTAGTSGELLKSGIRTNHV